MIVKALGALALTLIPFAPAVPQQMSYTDNPSIVQVVCKLSNGIGRGTAFRISPDYLVSAAHVTSLGNCSIDGRPIRVLVQDGDLDFALIYLPGDEPSMRINCGGFRRGEMYFSVGHAEGKPEKRVLVLIGSGQRVSIQDGRTPIGLLLNNRIIPGMSGGPLQNARGEVVGINNAYSPFYNISFSRELAQTPLCR